LYQQKKNILNQNLLGEQRTWYSNFGSSAECEPLVATYLDYSAAHARFDLPHASEKQQQHISITRTLYIDSNMNYNNAQ